MPGKTQQSAWWYLFRVKTYVANMEIDICSENEVRLIGQHLLLNVATARNDYDSAAMTYSLENALDSFVSTVMMGMKGSITNQKFFDWLAKRIILADDFHFRRSRQILVRNDPNNAKVLTMANFTKSVLECVNPSRPVSYKNRVKYSCTKVFTAN